MYMATFPLMHNVILASFFSPALACIFTLCIAAYKELKGEVNVLQERLASASEQNGELEKRLQIQEQLFHSKQTELQEVR